VLGAPIDNEDLTDKILEELGDEYRELVRAVQARENAISFDELHEKLLMFEASLQATSKTVTLFPPIAHQASRTSGCSSFHNVNRNLPNNFSYGGNWRSYPQPRHSGPTQSYTTNNSSRPPPRPYLGYCQICGIQGHTAKKVLPSDLFLHHQCQHPSRPCLPCLLHPLLYLPNQHPLLHCQYPHKPTHYHVIL